VPLRAWAPRGGAARGAGGVPAGVARRRAARAGGAGGGGWAGRGRRTVVMGGLRTGSLRISHATSSFPLVPWAVSSRYHASVLRRAASAGDGGAVPPVEKARDALSATRAAPRIGCRLGVRRPRGRGGSQEGERGAGAPGARKSGVLTRVRGRQGARYGVEERTKPRIPPPGRAPELGEPPGPQTGGAERVCQHTEHQTSTPARKATRFSPRPSRRGGPWPKAPRGPTLGTKHSSPPRRRPLRGPSPPNCNCRSPRPASDLHRNRAEAVSSGPSTMSASSARTGAAAGISPRCPSPVAPSPAPSARPCHLFAAPARLPRSLVPGTCSTEARIDASWPMSRMTRSR